MASLEGHSPDVPTLPLLLRLYPATWRARYGAEFETLLADRPPSPGDRLDIVLGAIDARLHPQLPTAAEAPWVATRGDHVTAALVVGGGSLITLWALLLAVAAPRWDTGVDVDPAISSLAFMVGWIGALAAAIGFLAVAVRHVEDQPDGGPLAQIAVAIGLILAALGTGPLGIFVLAGGSIGSAIALMRNVVPWPVALAFMLAAALFVVSQVGFVASGGTDTRLLWLLVPYGPSMAALGLSLRRGSRPRPALVASAAG